MTQEYKESVLLTIPTITNDKLKLFVDDVFIDELDVNQVNEYRLNILNYILKTGDESIIDRFYFVGHEDSDEGMSGEIKITMDIKGNLSDSPWEVNHIRRGMLKFLRLGRQMNEETHNI